MQTMVAVAIRTRPELQEVDTRMLGNHATGSFSLRRSLASDHYTLMVGTANTCISVVATHSIP